MIDHVIEETMIKASKKFNAIPICTTNDSTTYDQMKTIVDSLVDHEVDESHTLQHL